MYSCSWLLVVQICIVIISAYCTGLKNSLGAHYLSKGDWPGTFLRPVLFQVQTFIAYWQKQSVWLKTANKLLSMTEKKLYKVCECITGKKLYKVCEWQALIIRPSQYWPFTPPGGILTILHSTKWLWSLIYCELQNKHRLGPLSQTRLSFI